MRLCLVAFAVLLVVPAISALAQDKAPPAEKPLPKTIGKIERLDPAFDKLVPQDAVIEVLAGGFEWSEGPVWVKDHLLFSDIPHNKIVKYTPGKGAETFLQPAGYTGKEKFTGGEPGTNGLTLDSQGRLVMCCHGDRCIKRQEKDGTFTILADKYEGKRFNSPNDLAYHPSGDLYFTDPPYGLPKQFDDPGRELDWCGVYRLSKDGKVTLMTKEISRPNGIAIAPDGKFVIVAHSDGSQILRKFPLKEDGTFGDGKVFFDAKPLSKGKKGGPDGLKIDKAGNVWTTGPGGVLVLDPEGKLLGRIETGEATANCAFGDDGSTLYMTADMYLCKVKTTTKGW